jgi:hypothetical protein
MIDWIEEAVPLSNEATEVGKRPDLGRLFGRIIGDDRQPQAQLGEAHGCRREIDAEQIPLKHGPFPIRDQRPRMHPVQALQCAYHERARSDGGVQQSDSRQCLCCFPVWIQTPALGLSISTAETNGQKRTHPGVQQPVNHSCRGIEGTGYMAELRRHHTFEHPSEHVWSHASAGGVFSHSEMKPLEQPIERATPEIIGNVRLETALERMRLKETSIQEGDGTKREGSSTPTG